MMPTKMMLTSPRRCVVSLSAGDCRRRKSEWLARQRNIAVWLPNEDRDAGKPGQIIPDHLPSKARCSPYCRRIIGFLPRGQPRVMDGIQTPTRPLCRQSRQSHARSKILALRELLAPRMVPAMGGRHPLERIEMNGAFLPVFLVSTQHRRVVLPLLFLSRSAQGRVRSLLLGRWHLRSPRILESVLRKTSHHPLAVKAMGLSSRRLMLTIGSLVSADGSQVCRGLRWLRPRSKSLGCPA